MRESGVAAVVDPQWDIGPYLELSRLHGTRIEHVLETHNHADHVSGHGAPLPARNLHRGQSTSTAPRSANTLPISTSIQAYGRYQSIAA